MLTGSSNIFIFLIAFQFFMFSFLAIFIFLGSRRSGNRRKESLNYRTAIIVPTYNEEALIEQKISNILKNMNPKKGSIAIYVIDDGSKDKTCEIVKRLKEEKSLKNLFIIRNSENAGKATRLNSLFEKLKEDIFVITDADSMWEKGSLGNILKNFSDQKIGAVTGKILVALKGNAFALKEENAYRRFFDLWRRAESNLDSCSIFNGPLMAIRREVARRIKIDKDTYTDDIDLLFKVRRLGYRAVYEPNAIVYEFLSTSLIKRMRQEIRRSRGLTMVFLKNVKVLGRFGYFGRIIYPLSFYFHVFSPIVFLASALILPLFIIENPIFCLLLFLVGFLIPSIRTAALGFITRQMCILIGLFTRQKGKWNPIRA